jgi:hypothetical protein
MTQPDFKNVGVSDLVERFAVLGVEDDQAEKVDDIAKCNRVRRQMELIAKELKSRPGDQRRALVTLYDHPNIQVRLSAAKYTLAVEPEKARRLIEAIAESRCFPQAGDAGMCLVLLDRGIFVPR